MSGCKRDPARGPWVAPLRHDVKGHAASPQALATLALVQMAGAGGALREALDDAPAASPAAGNGCDAARRNRASKGDAGRVAERRAPMSHFSVLVIHRPDETVEELLAPYDEDPTFVAPELLQFVPDDDCDADPDTGQRGYWHNPLAKWDWWEIGGGWHSALPLKRGGRADSARISEIDFPSEGQGAPFHTYAVVKDGEWEEVGAMGWFGIGTETEEEAAEWARGFRERFIEGCDPDLIATIVDCHI